MKLKNSFFYIKDNGQQSTANGQESYDIELNPEHFIFKAHFPGNPIVPGVCQVKMISELLEEKLGRLIILSGVKNIKYLTVMTPSTQTRYTITFGKIIEQENGCKINVTYADQETLYTKLSLIYSY